MSRKVATLSTESSSRPDRTVVTVQSLPSSASEGPTTRQMLTLWVPLAASILIMAIEPSIINIGLGRTSGQERALAAYGVAYGLVLLIEAPILMLIDASIARSSDRASFVIIRRFTVLMGAIVTGAGLAFTLTPLYHLVVVDAMRIPADVAAWAQPTMILLSLWSFPIAWRRTYQGLLIRAGRTTVITVATLVRLVVLSIVLFAGLRTWPDSGAVLAGVAMDVSVIVEAVLITWAARPVLRLARSETERSRDRPLTMRTLWRFYRPLVTTSLLRQSTRSILSAGIAAAAMVHASLAAWPVAFGLATVIAGPALSLQQLTTALAGDGPAFRRVLRFSMVLSLVFTVLLALIALTPLYVWVMSHVYNLSLDLQRTARPALQLMVLLPALQGVQAAFRGSLIRHGSTKAVRTATLFNLAVLVTICVLAVRFTPVTGILLASFASQVSNVAELLWLWRENARC